MDAQQNDTSFVAAIADSPYVKAVLTVLTVYGTVAKYSKAANTRRRETLVLAHRYKFGWIFWVIQRLPFLIHSAVAALALAGSFLEALLLFDQFAFKSAKQKLFWPHVSEFLANFSSNFFWLFLSVAILYILFDLHAIEHAATWILGKVRLWRQTADWANAKWQLEPEAERRVLSPSRGNIDGLASRVIDELVSLERGDSLALRPAGTPDECAGNILYFGHVIEDYCARVKNQSFPWTVIYEALGKLAQEQDKPFSATSLRGLPPSRSFFSELCRANKYLPKEHQVPNDVGLEQAVRQSFEILRQKYSGDARRISAGIFRTDYTRVLKRSGEFLSSIYMCRQFAKLFVLWNVKPKASHPKYFQVPFNTAIFTRYLDDGVIDADGDRFSKTSELTDICFSITQFRLMERVIELLNDTQDSSRTAWISREREDVDKRLIDWSWWIYYRTDVQTYHDFREYKSQEWTRSGDEITRAPKKSRATDAGESGGEIGKPNDD